ncbi:MAG: tyrosine-type recombinase/integrase [Dermatophilaceae bacterium]
MTAFAPTLQAFFTDRLAAQKNASSHTIAAYRDTLRLLLVFTTERTGTPPERQRIEDIDAPLVGAFLDHLERQRGNSVRSRNARLAAIHWLFQYAALHHPEHAGLIARVLAIPPKRCRRVLVSFLDEHEIDALLAAPDTSRWIGRRDHALLLVAIQTGLRVSELTGLRCGDVHLGRGAHIRCTGKGRKARCTPLTNQTITVLRSWLAERRGQPDDPLFATSRGRPLTRDAIAWLLSKHAATASHDCPTMQATTITPHVLRHYVEGLVMWPGGVFPLLGLERAPVPAT